MSTTTEVAKNWPALKKAPVKKKLGKETLMMFGKYYGFSLWIVALEDIDYLRWACQYVRGDQLTPDLYEIVFPTDQ